MMKIAILVALFQYAAAFAPSSGIARFTRSSVSSAQCPVSMGYVPDGLTKEQYAAIKKKDTDAKKANLARVGQNRFRSRSFEAFQKALEKGDAGHLYPVDPNDYKKGKIKYEDIPYMQRPGGSWDNSDVKGAKKLKKNNYDDIYNEAKEQSISIFGGDALPWNNFGSASGKSNNGGGKWKEVEKAGMDSRKKKFMKQYGRKEDIEVPKKKKNGCTVM